MKWRYKSINPRDQPFKARCNEQLYIQFEQKLCALNAGHALVALENVWLEGNDLFRQMADTAERPIYKRDPPVGSS